MTKPEFKARVSNLDNRISILAARVLPLINSPTQRERYAKRLRVTEQGRDDEPTSGGI